MDITACNQMNVLNSKSIAQFMTSRFSTDGEIKAKTAYGNP